MDFGKALTALRAGRLVQREGWNGKGMFLYFVPGSEFEVNIPPLNSIFSSGTKIRYHAHIDMRTAQGDCVPWLASQTDLLAEDWQIVRLRDPSDPQSVEVDSIYANRSAIKSGDYE